MAKRRHPLKTVFLDSSGLFTAVNSPSGGSSKLFTLNQIQLITSSLVLTEVERNVKKKLETYHLERFFILVSNLKILKQTPESYLVKLAQKEIAQKDAVILAEAKSAKTDFLVTLDKKHFLTEQVVKFLIPQQPLTPKMLLDIIGKKNY